MRLSSRMAAVVLGAALTGVAGAPALAASGADRDCGDFASQAEAQATLDADPSDPNRLDGDDDGRACEAFDYPSSGGSTDPSGDTSGSADGSSSASGDRDCEDFSSQQEAQAYYEGQAGDPDRLDDDDDGQACEAYAYAATGQGGSGGGEPGGGDGEMVMPSGGVDTGVGGAADSADAGLLAAGGALALAGAGGVVVVRRRQAPRS